MIHLTLPLCLRYWGLDVTPKTPQISASEVELGLHALELVAAQAI